MAATWTGLQPNTKYRVFVLAHYFLGGTTAQTVTITGNGSDNPPPFVQTVSGSLQINEMTATAQPLTSVAKEVTSTAGGTIAVSVDKPGGETWISGLAIQEVRGTPPPGCLLTNLVSSAPQMASTLYETKAKITSNQKISGAGVLVEYNGGNEVVLSSGFEVGLNAGLTAGNRGCANP